jgi:hypothetical protein
MEQWGQDGIEDRRSRIDNVGLFDFFIQLFNCRFECHGQDISKTIGKKAST